MITVFYDVDTRELFTSSTLRSCLDYIVLSTAAIFAFALPFVLSLPQVFFDKNKLKNNKKKFSQYALIFIVLATFGELLNMYRAGGMGLLAYGKAVYQAEVGNLFLSIPSTFFLQVGTFFLGLRLYLSYEERLYNAFKSKILVISIIILIPIMMLYFSIGFRSPILAISVAFIIGFTYFQSIKRVNRKVLGLIFIGYSALAILFGIRGQLKLLFLTGDWNAFNEYVVENKSYLLYYNPANNEFGASFMNYIHFHRKANTTPLLYGKSYLEGVLISIPGALLPFEKPLPIDFKFRDLYFSEYKEASRISGTGFSSIMEAQWNYGFLGPFLVYLVLGSFVWVLEFYRNSYKYLFIFPLFYAMIVPISQSFHRSASGFYVSYSILLVAFLIVIVLIKTILSSLRAIL
ncbi:oligosaccharide repeat unit polymerase [uncultured Maribacter sp.]|uniref:oligosaccharide repeat unit polymerase n=1 Tax=uncultured Maribacter sp. TaxID=431308 RepID=UPI002602534D|nr:oligosaccharide repeat unit polymerase [uncultured Maribacter sp.]